MSATKSGMIQNYSGQEMFANSMQSQPQVIMKPEAPKQTVITQITLNQLSISLIGKVQQFFKEKVVNRRQELALFTIKGLRYYGEDNQEKN